jgi:hypothetical protein
MKPTLLVIALCFTLAGCDRPEQVTLRGYPASPFFQRISYDLVPVGVASSSSAEADTSWIDETRGGAGKVLSPLTQYPEIEHYLLLTYVGRGSMPELAEMWELVLSPLNNVNPPTIEWTESEDLTLFRYGEYALPTGGRGRIWIELEPNHEARQVGVHFRLVEQTNIVEQKLAIERP